MQNQDNKIYIALNKPVDYTTATDEANEKSVVTLLTKYNNVQNNARDIQEPLQITEKLEANSEGLVFLTSDMNLINLLARPNFEHEKEYEVVIDKALSKDAKKVLEHGMRQADTFAQGITIKKEFNKGKRTIVTITVAETKAGQIRNMFEILGYHVVTLRRTRMGKLRLGTLAVGKWKFVSRESII